MEIKIEGVGKTIDNFTMYGRGLRKATARAMNDGVSYARTHTRREVRDTYAIKDSDLRSLTKTTRARERDLTASFTIKSHSIPLRLFTTKYFLALSREQQRKKKGVRYKVKKQEGTKVLEGSFINISKTRKRPYVLMRKTEDRYPLRPQTVLTPTSMFKAVNGVEMFERLFNEKFEERFEHYIRTKI